MMKQSVEWFLTFDLAHNLLVLIILYRSFVDKYYDFLCNFCMLMSLYENYLRSRVVAYSIVRVVRSMIAVVVCSIR